MTLGLYETRARRKRRMRWAVVKWMLALAAIVAAGAFAYDTGSKLGQQRAITLEAELEATSERVAELVREKDGLQVALEQTRNSLADLEERYGKDVPSGPLAEIQALARDKLGEGIEAERILFVLGAVEQQRDCDAAPLEKRFLVSTPLSVGGNDSVGFADGTLVVTAEGESALTADGKPEAWFDPALPVTLRFASLDGRVSEASGVLPLRHSQVTGGREYRFNAVPGARGFIQVTGDSCVFP